MEFQKEELDEILNIFQQESMEIISSMDGKLLMLENDSNNQELATQLFRDAHSLKGSARMLGFVDIQNIAHKIEDIISLIKENKLRITQKITDTISECLEFISDLINKTVEQKEEYKSDEIEKYIAKLIEIAQNTSSEDNISNLNDEDSALVKELLGKYAQIEENTIEALYIVSCARKNNHLDYVLNLEDKINHLIFIFDNLNNQKIQSIKAAISKLQNTILEYKNSINKSVSFLEINACTIEYIEKLTATFNALKINHCDFYEIVDKKLENIEQQKLKTQISELKAEKINNAIEQLPLLEYNNQHYNDVINLIIALSANSENSDLKKAYSSIKEVLEFFQNKNILIPRDICQGLKEILETIQKQGEPCAKEIQSKIEIIKTLAKFEAKNYKEKPKNAEISQKEILNSITNTEIKTLRVDSVKLDNLVSQISELIVSKIKTNEQLSLVKHINNSLVEWQKNFSKMNYYIKYFDKKYFSNPIDNQNQDFRKMVAYNKQLSTLSELHSEKILEFINETSHLFKQLQETEARLNATTTEIETMVKNMRVLPLSTIFQLFPRMVHNIARDKNKKIDLIIDGADVTADKTIIEEIKIPLMHIIRNSIDHGIEDVATRKALGKNPVGKIEIKATNQDNNLVIDVKDDGKGLDIEKIKEKALEKNLLTPEELNAISNEELTNLIFYPGFSTEDFVTELSGRGLGLDIVSNKISQLQGRIDIYSQINIGTLVRIILPASVATKKITPHKLRSTYGTQLYKETGDIYLVADILGHKDVNTTKKHYAALEEERRRSAKDAVTLREKQ